MRHLVSLSRERSRVNPEAIAPPASASLDQPFGHAPFTERRAPQFRHKGRILMTNWPARAAQMISWPVRAARYVEQQGNDKLARSGRALCGAARQ